MPSFKETYTVKITHRTDIDVVVKMIEDCVLNINDLSSNLKKKILNNDVSMVYYLKDPNDLLLISEHRIANNEDLILYFLNKQKVSATHSLVEHVFKVCLDHLSLIDFTTCPKRYRSFKNQYIQKFANTYVKRFLKELSSGSYDPYEFFFDSGSPYDILRPQSCLEYQKAAITQLKNTKNLATCLFNKKMNRGTKTFLKRELPEIMNVVDCISI